MNANQTSKQFRILAISLSSRGFGYAVIEGDNALVFYGKKRIDGDKNAGLLSSVKKVVARSQPGILVLQDVNAKGTHRAPRIKELHRKIIALAKNYRIRVAKVSGTELRSLLLGNEAGTKQEIAELLAKQFSDELATRLPPKRKAWTSEDSRMDIFDAVGLAVTLRLKKLKQREHKELLLPKPAMNNTAKT